MSPGSLSFANLEMMSSALENYAGMPDMRPKIHSFVVPYNLNSNNVFRAVLFLPYTDEGNIFLQYKQLTTLHYLHAT